MQKLTLDKLPDLLVPREVAALFRVTPLTVKRWVKSGKLKMVRINTRGDMRFNKIDVLALLKEVDG